MDNLSIDIVSDLHIDQWDDTIDSKYPYGIRSYQPYNFNDSKSDILVIAGDISDNLDMSLKFIDEIENCLEAKALKKYLPMQKGDLEETFADCSLLFSLTGYKPNTEIKKGIKSFCEWYIEYYEK